MYHVSYMSMWLFYVIDFVEMASTTAEHLSPVANDLERMHAQATMFPGGKANRKSKLIDGAHRIHLLYFVRF